MTSMRAVSPGRGRRAAHSPLRWFMPRYLRRFCGHDAIRQQLQRHESGWANCLTGL